MSGGREVIDHPQRGAHHDDVSLVVAGCLVALATPITGAEAFIEHYRRMVEEPWRFQHNTDFDRVRPTGPDFGFNFGTQQIADLVRVTIPPDVWPSTLIGASGQSYLVGAAPNGERFVMMSPDDAKALVCSPMMSSSWREMNPNL